MASLLQICPPSREYPKVFTAAMAEDPANECSFPEALKFIEDKCHGVEACSLTTAPSAFVQPGDAARNAGAAAATAATDPCPGVRKYVEAAFKCKPNQFRSRGACHGERMTLTCADENERVAIYSAHFSSAVGTHHFCSVGGGGGGGGDDDYSADDGGTAVIEDYLDKYGLSELNKCEASDATEAVMQLCHGKSKSCC